MKILILLTKGAIFRCYGFSRPIKRELIIYGTAKPREKLANENAMALLGQLRENGTSRSRGVNKNVKTFRKQNKNKNKSEKQIENKNQNPFSFSFSFLFLF